MLSVFWLFQGTVWVTFHCKAEVYWRYFPKSVCCKKSRKRGCVWQKEERSRHDWFLEIESKSFRIRNPWHGIRSCRVFFSFSRDRRCLLSWWDFRFSRRREGICLSSGMLHGVLWWKLAGVSEVLITSLIALTTNHTETSVIFYQITWRITPEDIHLHLLCCYFNFAQYWIFSVWAVWRSWYRTWTFLKLKARNTQV